MVQFGSTSSGFKTSTEQNSRLVESESDESKKEDAKSDSSEGENEVSPTHVRGFRAAGSFTGRARGQTSIASVLGY